MADDITELMATWMPNQGVQLNWTAADDATTGSSYIVYVLTNTDQTIPTWSQITKLGPNVSRKTAETFYSLTAPTTSYLFTFSGKGNASYAFNIIHVDNTGAKSPGVTVSVFPPSVFASNIAGHLPNQISIDSFGQFITNLQDTYEEVSSSVAMLLGTIVGSRSVVPTYGIQDLPLTEINASEIQGAISKWEDRADAQVTLKYDDNNNASINVKIANN